jgi:hypothetical protein
MALLAFFKLLIVLIQGHDLVKMHFILQVVVKLKAFERLEHLLGRFLHYPN